MNMQNSHPPRESAISSIGRLALLVGASTIPIAGGPVGVFIAEAYERRSRAQLEGWLSELASKLEKLQIDGFSEAFDQMLNREDFLTVFMESVKLAERTALKEKLAALQNAILNSVTSDQELDIRLMYLRYVEELTTSHLLLLELLDNPRSFYESRGLVWADWMMGGKMTLIREAFPHWDTTFAELLTKDLHARGLVGTATLQGITTPQAMADSSTTSFGQGFIRFISENPSA
ncbi:unannotated protein [freshwater metagenome]|uniref:Unannotated protein n=1 Tax=freshwater metagenome TaxID=449393 RepID=A0A6J6IT16_9ZZZZ